MIKQLRCLQSNKDPNLVTILTMETKVVVVVVPLVLSLCLNLFFYKNLYLEGGKWNRELTWTQKAAAEAEEVARVSCSGHGRAYLDGLRVDGKAVCECNACFAGTDCSESVPDCVANADGGDPLFLEPYWINHAASSALVVSGWHRMSYSFSDQTSISQQLKILIRKVHYIAKNAITEDKYIVFGVGSTQLLNAAVYALSPDNSSSPASVVAAIPYYSLYQMQTDYYKSVNFKFQGDPHLWKNNSDTGLNLIEFVTSPNNPDCNLNTAVLQGPNVKTIYDHAYYWPHFTAISAPADGDLMVFTLSKLTGHAGSRFGWAVVKDKKVYERMLNYITISELGTSKDTQLRALKLLKVALEGDGKSLFEFAFEAMKRRWEKLFKILSMSRRFSIQQIAPQYCTFSEQVRGPSPAYAWVKCEREEDKNCYAVLQAANISGREGSRFGAEDRYVRLSLLRGEDDFNSLLDRLAKLVFSQEENGTKEFI